MRGRVATAAHPLCTCREHDHVLDANRCIGTRLYFRTTEGGEPVQGTCRIFGGIEPHTRDSCVMHGDRSQPADVLVADASGQVEFSSRECNNRGAKMSAQIAERPANRLDHDHCERQTPHTPHIARWHQHVETWCDGRPASSRYEPSAKDAE